MTVYPSGKSKCCAARTRAGSTTRVRPIGLQVGRTTVQSRACYALRRCYNYVATTDLQGSAGGRDSLCNLGYSSQVQCSLVPSPTPNFCCLPYVYVACRTYTSLAVGQATKSWAWDWERGYHELETAAADRSMTATSQAPPPASLITYAAPPGPPSL